MSPFSILSPRDVSYLDAVLLDADQRLRVVPAATLAPVPYDDIRYWCNRRAVYGLPTTELVAWLQERVAGRSAIEIGSGNGCLGRALGIPRTDSHIQATAEMQLLYMAQGQPVIAYGADVERVDAYDAVRKHRPEVVVGQWVTQYVDAQKPVPVGGGSIYGIRERAILAEPRVQEYLVVGNFTVHGTKDIFLNPPRGWKVDVLRAPWIWSRATNPAENCVMSWSRFRKTKS